MFKTIREKDGITLVFPPNSSGDKVSTENLDLVKLNDWSNFEEGFEKFSIYISSEFKQNAYLIPLTCNKWTIARKFLIKKEWDSKTKIHSKRKVAKELKPLGDLLISYFYLCERCHSCDIDLSIFGNASELFSKIFTEIIAIDLINAFYPPQDIYCNNRKLAWIEIEREKLRSLKKFTNPFIKYRLIGLEMLTNSAFRLASGSDQFARNFWKPYLKNYEQYIQHLSSPCWGRVYEENGDVYFQMGKGEKGTGRTLMAEMKWLKSFLFESPTG